MPGREAPIVVVSYLDAGYLSRALAMFESLQGDPGVSFVFLAWDLETRDTLSNLPDAVVIHIDSFLSGNPLLQAAIKERNKAESFFTVGPAFLRWVVESRTSAQWVVYADSDIFFYQPLSLYLEKYNRAAAVIVPHRHYPWNRKRLAKFGEFNVGVVAFRNIPSGRTLISYWADACQEWCFDTPNSDRYADQKYLEDFPKISEDVQIDTRIGANLAPWNIGRSRISHSKSGALLAQGETLFYFHFQGLVRSGGLWRLGHARYLSLATSNQRKLLYGPYIDTLERITERLAVSRAGSARKSQNCVGLLFSYVSWVIDLVTFQFIIVRRSSEVRNSNK